MEKGTIRQKRITPTLNDTPNRSSDLTILITKLRPSRVNLIEWEYNEHNNKNI